jgi:hypothetical protein
MNSTRWSLSITVSALATTRRVSWRVGSSSHLMISSSIRGQSTMRDIEAGFVARGGGGGQVLASMKKEEERGTRI